MPALHRSIAFIAALCAALSFFGCADPMPAAGAGTVATVVKVRDGDSLVLEVQGESVEVRLHGIDAPERGQPHGDAARQALIKLTRGARVQLERRAVDRYERQVAVITTIGAAKSVNQSMLEQGHAWHYLRYDQNPAWADAQRSAQQARRGLWVASSPTPPWQWRRR